MRCWQLLPLVLCGLLLDGAASQSGAAEPQPAAEYSASERGHWAFLPRGDVRPPDAAEGDTAEDRAWLRTPVDAFVWRQLRAADLRPAPEAAPEVLVRRLYFDLHGLPPTPAEVEEFLADGRPDAYERLVDRLLASPRYGERWGQHWLDVVRYAETEGFEYDRHRAGAWRFRDYVIQSWNADKPFDRMLLEQVAGDELPAPSPEAQVAVGFHRLGPVRRNAGNTDVAFSRNEVLTEMTDAIGFVFLGLTVGCARCHDHMFDAIRQRDYYQLQAFLAATQEHDVLLADAETAQAWKEQDKQIQQELLRIREELSDAEGERREQLTAELRATEERLPPPLPTISSVQNDPQVPAEVHVLTRGSTDHPAEAVRPRALGVLLPPAAPSLAPKTPHPKLALAQWLADPAHPLPARVIANRLWHYHFGRGLVATPNDFGVNGQPPSHPELLDYLANEVVTGNWHLKRIQRLLVTSSAYRQASTSPAAGAAHTVDPDNRLLWKFPRRRLSGEEVRDAMLAVAGRLNEEQGGPSVIPPVEQELVDLLYKPSQWEVTADPADHDRRSIYLIAKRNLRVPFLEVFDQPDLQLSCPVRVASTHAPQSLEMLNGDLSNRLAARFAERLAAEAGADPGQQVELAFRLATGRLPNSRERELARQFLQSQPLEEFALAMFNLNGFLYVE